MAQSLQCVLIANRGEIAARVARSVRARGARAVGVFSDADADALHTQFLDAAVRLPGRAPSDTYLNVQAILDAAKRLGARAVHPGYGFLSENASFAQACVDAGLVFVGPSPEAIQAMGDKARAKRLMERRGVPLVPGYSGEDQNDATLRAEAERIGTPLLLKAAAGGGGRGMRRVTDLTELDDAIASARREAKGAFGNDTLIIERLIERPRHVELQIVGDSHGNVAHLFERECSVQRRHQKIIEEAPSPAVGSELRARMGEAAVAAARAVGYVGAGTVEFLLDDQERFYFIEMNTRLQVEHPVTELATGIDLVDLQLAIAEGEPLPELPEAPEGHAIEARIYAEDPYDDFSPQTGTLRDVVWPANPGVRVDSGVWSGQVVGVDYDPMLAKVIAVGEDRERARLRLLRALEDTVLFGVGTNTEFLCSILDDPTFVAGDARTDWLDSRTSPRLDHSLPRALAALRFLANDERPLIGGLGRSARLELGGEILTARLNAENGGRELLVGEERYRIGALGADWAELDGVRHRFDTLRDAESLWVSFRGVTLEARRALSEALGRRSTGDGNLRAPMAGKVVMVGAAIGEPVSEGQTLVVIEAMKMEHELRAIRSGRLSRLTVEVGAQVEARQVLAEIEPVEENAHE